MPIYSLQHAVETEIEIRKSRFIAYVTNIENRAHAQQFIQTLHLQHPNATHICWALLAQGHSGMSDDGEPSGTAARPIMEVLRHHQLDQILGVVIRYFSGVKLGAGGLIRAYSEAISTALRQAVLIEHIAQVHWRIHIDYADEAKIRAWCLKTNITILDARHLTHVQLLLKFPANQQNEIENHLFSFTKGHITIEKSISLPR